MYDINRKTRVDILFPLNSIFASRNYFLFVDVVCHLNERND